MKSTNSHRWDTEGAKKKKEVLRKPELNLKSEAIKWVIDFRNRCQPEVPRGHKINQIDDGWIVNQTDK